MFVALLLTQSQELNLKGILKSILKGAQPCCDQQSPSRYRNTNDLYQYLNAERCTSLRICDNVVCVMMVMLCLTHLHLVATLAGGKCSRAVASGDPGFTCCTRSLFANPVKKYIYFSCSKKNKNTIFYVQEQCDDYLEGISEKIDPINRKCMRNANDPWVNLTKICAERFFCEIYAHIQEHYYKLLQWNYKRQSFQMCG